MALYTIAHAKNRLSGLIDRALSGEEVIVMFGKKAVRIVPCDEIQPRRLGSAEGDFVVPGTLTLPCRVTCWKNSSGKSFAEGPTWLDLTLQLDSPALICKLCPAS